MNSKVAYFLNFDSETERTILSLDIHTVLDCMGFNIKG